VTRIFSSSPGLTAGDPIDWLTIADQAETVTSDVGACARRRAPTYDVTSGKLIEVPEATEAVRV